VAWVIILGIILSIWILVGLEPGSIEEFTLLFIGC
jgi:hypothetical protein